MDAIRQYLKNPVYAAILGFIVGLIIGLPVLGWGPLAVKYTGAGPRDMVYDEKVEYMRMSMEAFTQNHLVEKAQERYNALGEDAAQILVDIQKDPGSLTADQIQTYKVAVSSPVVSSGGATPVPGGAALQPTVVPTQAPSSGGIGGFFRSLLPILCVLVLIAIAVGVVFFLRTTRGPRPETRPDGSPAAPAGPTPAQQALQAARQAAWTDYSTAGTEPPMAQFMSSYKIGDDLFDDSFSIDSPSGEFLGECGVGISETIGVGDPKKVTAFEVWLFDKNDIQTVTKVIMSQHAFSDDSIRQRLAAKGEPLNLSAGGETVLETQTLRMVARVVDMGYADGPLPTDSFFDRFILEIAVWQKA